MNITYEELLILRKYSELSESNKAKIEERIDFFLEQQNDRSHIFHVVNKEKEIVPADPEKD